MAGPSRVGRDRHWRVLGICSGHPVVLEKQPSRYNTRDQVLVLFARVTTCFADSHDAQRRTAGSKEIGGKYFVRSAASVVC